MKKYIHRIHALFILSCIVAPVLAQADSVAIADQVEKIIIEKDVSYRLWRPKNIHFGIFAVQEEQSERLSADLGVPNLFTSSIDISESIDVFQGSVIATVGLAHQISLIYMPLKDTKGGQIGNHLGPDYGNKDPNGIPNYPILLLKPLAETVLRSMYSEESIHFDVRLESEKMVMLYILQKGSLTVWQGAIKNWASLDDVQWSKVQSFALTESDSFCCISHYGNLLLFFGGGGVYQLFSDQVVPLGKIQRPLGNRPILVDDRRLGIVYATSHQEVEGGIGNNSRSVLRNGVVESGTINAESKQIISRLLAPAKSSE